MLMLLWKWIIDLLKKKWTYFDNRIVWRPRTKVMQHFLKGENVGLVIPRINKEDNCCFISNRIIGHKLCSAYDSNSLFPLYLYPVDVLLGSEQRKPNLNAKIVAEIAERLNLRFTEEKENIKKTFAPIDILDYIYAVLHSPAYREQYKEFLKIDFPRVPYPQDVKQFRKLVKLGGKLRHFHLMEGVEPKRGLANYDIGGNNVAEVIEYKNGKVRINKTQYFDNVLPEVWNFYIGGYQPAQKWLKDRKGRTLSFDDIRHYQKIIHALKETMEVMNEVDNELRG